MRRKGIRHFKLKGVSKPFQLHSTVDQFEAQRRKTRLQRTHNVRLLQKMFLAYPASYRTEIWIRKRK